MYSRWYLFESLEDIQSNDKNGLPAMFPVMAKPLKSSKCQGEWLGDELTH
jgi:hypothetical protein